MDPVRPSSHAHEMECFELKPVFDPGDLLTNQGKGSRVSNSSMMAMKSSGRWFLASAMMLGGITL